MKNFAKVLNKYLSKYPRRFSKMHSLAKKIKKRQARME
jgi:hypothetical protein